MNLNDYVWVQLTDAGRDIHRKNHAALFSGYVSRLPDFVVPKYVPPTEDAEGWSKWQLWVLMAEFGAHMHIGMRDQPMSTQIRLDDPAQTTKTPSEEGKENDDEQ